jgi:hypothetical protein
MPRFRIDYLRYHGGNSQEISMSRLLIVVLLAVTGLGACSPEPAATATAPATVTASPPARASGDIAGTIAEAMNAGGYTYARLRTGTTDSWVAANEFPATVGDQISATIDMPMENFNSKTLNRSFPLIYFVKGVTRSGVAVAAAGPGGELALAESHAPAPNATVVSPIKPAPGGITIADLWMRRKALAGTVVVISGKVVKVNNEILGSNWIHLQDGSGSAQSGTHDLTVTTSALVKVGDVVTITGKLATGKDLGSGYAYEVIVENATVARSTAANN